MGTGAQLGRFEQGLHRGVTLRKGVCPGGCQRGPHAIQVPAARTRVARDLNRLDEAPVKLRKTASLRSNLGEIVEVAVAQLLRGRWLAATTSVQHTSQPARNEGRALATR